MFGYICQSELSSASLRLESNHNVQHSKHVWSKAIRLSFVMMSCVIFPTYMSKKCYARDHKCRMNIPLPQMSPWEKQKLHEPQPYSPFYFKFPFFLSPPPASSLFSSNLLCTITHNLFLHSLLPFPLLLSPFHRGHTSRMFRAFVKMAASQAYTSS